MNPSIIQLTDANFDTEVSPTSGRVLVDFWAPWCAPCKIFAPIFEEVAGQYIGKLRFAKIDVEAYPAIWTRFGIRGIPTVILFLNGEVQATKIGGLSKKSQLTAFIDSNI